LIGEVAADDTACANNKCPILHEIDIDSHKVNVCRKQWFSSGIAAKTGR
jgi:hypothetical protein